MILRSRETGVATAGMAITMLAVVALVPRHTALDAPSAEVTRGPFADTTVGSGTLGAQR